VKSIRLRLVLLGAGFCFTIALVILVVTAPPHPVALLRVVDARGKPIVGATIVPEGLRTKDGPYRSGWYGWRTESNTVTNAPVITDEDGWAQVPYPKFVFERIETGVLCLTVDHPDFVPDRPERTVAAALPAGAPLKSRVKDLWDRVRRKALISRPDPIVLQQGSALKISTAPNDDRPADARLFAQVSGVDGNDSNFWLRPEPDVIFTRRLAAGMRAARAVMLSSNEVAWFSEIVPITASAGQTNELVLTLKRGAMVRGQLAGATTPIKKGRVVAHIWPHGAKPQENPPQWHAWTTVKEDGSFTISSLPEGDLEIVAMCDGFVSTNGPGQHRMRYPQKHFLGSTDLSVTLGMEPTARLEVKVTDGSGKALPGVRVMTWPNVRYGEWAASILMSDCYRTADFLLRKAEAKSWWNNPVPGFQGVSDTNGLAVLENLPSEVDQLAIEHSNFALPIVRESTGQQHRQASFTLVAGKTNRISIQLEPKDSSAISHY
jgi:hypothetical protein